MKIRHAAQSLDRSINLHGTRKEDQDASVFVSELTVNVSDCLCNEIVVDAKSNAAQICGKRFVLGLVILANIASEAREVHHVVYVVIRYRVCSSSNLDTTYRAYLLKVSLEDIGVQCSTH